jgi:hypothetical protein
VLVGQPDWRRSSACVGGECVEVAALPDGIAIRQMVGEWSGQLLFTMDEWTAFVGGVKAGEFDDLSLGR